MRAYGKFEIIIKFGRKTLLESEKPHTIFGKVSIKSRCQNL